MPLQYTENTASESALFLEENATYLLRTESILPATEKALEEYLENAATRNTFFAEVRLDEWF